MNWIILVIIITIAVASAIAQTIKSQQEKAKEEAPRRRSTARSGEGVRTGSSDMDRFLQEIEKLRKRTADGTEEPKKANAKSARTAASVPTVAAKKSKRQDAVPTVAPKQRVDRLPAAKVLPQAQALPTAPSEQVGGMSAFPMAAPAAAATSVKPITPFGQNLIAMLSRKDNLASAFVLQEIFGPPKCKKS